MTRLAPLLLLALWLWPLAVLAAPVEGRVVLDDDPVPGVRVEAHASLDFSGEAVALSAPTDADGLFRLELPPGTYALYARDEARGLFAQCGRNPLTVAESSQWAGLQAVRTRPPTKEVYGDEYSAAVEGRVLHRGEPLAGAYVYLYLDAAEDLKGQGYRMSLPTGTDGRFAFDGLPESGYYLVVRKRSDGQRVGPVREGDYFGVYPGNPVQAVAGRSLQVTMPAVMKVRAEQRPLEAAGPSGPVVRGVVADGQGRPAAGLYVFAYTERVVGHKRPAALSAAVGENGAFMLRLPQAGTYYLGAREYYGDSPAPGERFGMYDATADHGLEVKAGQLVEGLTIVVEPIQLY